jgi:hypothetical protein
VLIKKSVMLVGCVFLLSGCVQKILAPTKLNKLSEAPLVTRPPLLSERSAPILPTLEYTPFVKQEILSNMDTVDSTLLRKVLLSTSVDDRTTLWRNPHSGYNYNLKKLGERKMEDRGMCQAFLLEVQNDRHKSDFTLCVFAKKDSAVYKVESLYEE